MWLSSSSLARWVSKEEMILDWGSTRRRRPAMETKMVVEGRGGADGVRGTADSSGGRLLRMVAWGRGVELGFVATFSKV
jgi:2-keto-3-deoxy-galactonokinase